MEENNKTITVNGKVVSLEELQQIQQDPKKKLVEEAPNKYKLLERMFG
jgi:hypothetical protein